MAAAPTPPLDHVPRLHYRHGYSVEVEGARAISPPGAPILVLRRNRDADAVSVELAPAN